MYKIILILFVISFFGCTPFKEYKYFTGSVLAEDKNSPIQYDSIMITEIKPGYYYWILPKDTTERIDYNEIEWIYVSKNFKIKQFTTANVEYCMLDMYWKQNPKQIYKQIKYDQLMFDSLYLNCNNEEFAPSRLHEKNDWIIVLGPANDIINYEELLFVKGGLIHKIQNYSGVSSMNKYKYIGN
jgi:hypothetical protein